MSDSLEHIARSILRSAPCSLEMPAGTGKTHLLAAVAASAHGDGKRSLILTHTHAGVDAMRKRLKEFAVPSSAFHIDTITSWAFSLARAYSEIGEVVIPEVPDWADSALYVGAASRVARASAIVDMHRQSFDYFLVDEYQDCNLKQHEFLAAISRSVPDTIVFGDRLQGIFGFDGETLVDWESDVFPLFPIFQIDCSPHRWSKHNQDLGQWLLALRPYMVDGSVLDLASYEVPGLRWVAARDGALVSIARSFRNPNESVLVLDKWPASVVRHAILLGGTYAVMEDMQGTFMAAEIADLPAEDSFLLAVWLAKFAKKCAVGLAGINDAVLKNLSANKPVAHYKRTGLGQILDGLDRLRESPSWPLLSEVASCIASTNGVKIYRWEAWRDTIRSIDRAIENGSIPSEELACIRDQLRHSGRRPFARIASRTVLVKGLEYDHVIIANVDQMRDPRNLYVALTRARKSVTVIGSCPRITLKNDN